MYTYIYIYPNWCVFFIRFDIAHMHPHFNLNDQ